MTTKELLKKIETRGRRTRVFWQYGGLFYRSCTTKEK